MAYAMEIGIDAFALNNANIDSYTPTQLANAYQAAQNVGFKCFISFDFAYWSNGNTADITRYMNLYAGHPAAMQYNGGAIVSTFVGDSFDWGPVKAGTSHQIFAIPMMQDPAEALSLHTSFDGAFSWYAWPTDGGNSIIPGPMTTIWDDRYVTDLAGKPYMARESFSLYLLENPELTFTCSCISLVLHALQLQELGLHLWGVDHWQMEPNALAQAWNDWDYYLEW